MEKILVIGAGGQLGTELVLELRSVYGEENVLASDLKKVNQTHLTQPYMQLDACDYDAVLEVIKNEKISQVYHLAAILSANAETDPRRAWDINMDSLLHILEIARLGHIRKLYWPSSIAVFGPDTPKKDTPQFTLTSPTAIYGISKLAGERWCEYYHKKYGVDVRSLRYPGLIGYKSLPGGGTTDYAVDIFHKAIKGEKFISFLSKDTVLPMMYMRDAVRATLQLMESPAESLTVRSSYNVASMSFSPQEIYEELRVHFPTFVIEYNPDHRQQIANSWPSSIDDTVARTDWNWRHQYDLGKMTVDMIKHLK
ncbi:unnamed protein product [Symbiodinium microadriaticum]|nr:unnamed protein product [Symbiodinium microadriaticum]